jgi:hypothetical protein
MKNVSKLAKIDLAVIAAERTPDIFEARKAACAALRAFAPAAVKTVEDAVNAAVVEGRRVYATVEQLVEQLGRVDLAAVVGALVLMHSTDGRISAEVVEWARRTQYAPELAATDRVDTYRLHMAHLDNLASALMRWEREHPAGAEPVDAEPVQVIEAEAVEAAPVAEPAPVAAEAAPAEAEPVKAGRKARKPRKSAPVAAEAAPVADPVPVVDPAAVEAGTRIKEQGARRGEPRLKIPEGCTATVIDGVIIAVSSCGDLTSNPAPVADAEPVKAGRKARKPRKAATVAVEPVEAAPVAEPVAVAAEPVEMAAADAEPVQVIEAEPVRSVAAAAAVAPVVEALSVPAAVDPAALSGWRFAADTVEVSGRVLPVSYSVTRSDEVYAFTALDGVAVRLHIGKGDELYAAALAAARGEAEARKAARMEPVEMAPVAAQAVSVDVEPVEAEAVADPAPVAAEAAPAEAEPVKADRKARKPRKAAPVAAEAEAVAVEPIEMTAADAQPVQVVEAEAVTVTVDAAPVAVEAVPAAAVEGCAQGKSWAGSSIAGDGWRIVFDAVEERTRVFCAAPTDAQKAAIEGAGFWWSPRMNSWNKKLTCKAYRAAVALAEELRRIA